MHTPSKITDSHRIAYYYLYIAVETDKQLASSEMMLITKKIENYISSSDNLNAWDIVGESLNWFNSLNPTQKEECFYSVISHFNKKFSKNQKLCILKDLKELAKSDGVVVEAEKDLIHKTEKLLKS